MKFKKTCKKQQKNLHLGLGLGNLVFITYVHCLSHLKYHNSVKQTFIDFAQLFRVLKFGFTIEYSNIFLNL